MKQSQVLSRFAVLVLCGVATTLASVTLMFAQSEDFAAEASRLMQAMKWTEARALLQESLRKMPEKWTPLEIQHDEKTAKDKVIVYSWDFEEYLGFTTGHPAYAGKDNVWLRPSYSQAYYLLAFIDQELGNDISALAFLNKALELEPDHPKLLAEKGYIYQRQKKYQESLELYKKAENVRPWAPKTQIARALRGEGFDLIELGQSDAAESAYKKSLELEPGNKLALNELSYIQSLKGKSTIDATVPTGAAPIR